MKNIKVLLSIALVLFVTNEAFSQDKVITKDQLPASITKYLNDNFPNNKILQATVDNDLFSKDYDVILSDGISVDFDSKNNVKEISSQTYLPENVIPKKILNYVKSNYKANKIKKYELDDLMQNIELDNGMELEFTMSGDFYKMEID
jgi:hypothetical protein